MGKISIIIALDNHFELTDNFFQHLIENVNTSDCEIIVALDGCKNIDVINYVRKIENDIHQVRTITLTEKVGYAIANNEAVKASTGDYLVFINTDVFPEDDAIQELVKYLEHNESESIVQGLLLYPQNYTIQSSGHVFGNYFNRHALKNRNYNSLHLPTVIDRQALTSAFYAMKRNTFERLNMFDEFFYNCWDGMEFTLRAKESNVKNICLTPAIAFHSTGGARNYMHIDETQQSAYFWSKWGSRIDNDLSSIIKDNESIFKKNYYTLINCSFIQKIDDYFQDLNITINNYLELSGKSNKINFYYELPYSMLTYPEPLILFTENYKDVVSNQHWIKLRNNEFDIIVDTSGNVFPLTDLI